ncbi:methylated-DNA--[protein]-cysteine S-methyltransferase [Macrococcus equipercicus]|uniref:Methylated-DNA--protein-cysteine methyltransferase n=1 Tax=Macrococcus equipercicus TaxID=69967 RepID=A0A9Q9F1M6_9STAP|nr:methylated-DNA--[protein]-cysteine S-methyltransferase [Macrococcus equipercicus]UTH14233.1 methylated-DNA--[protein]-cysteine S-methyltransferase [Macrococcus equipercicus]
MIYLSEWQHGDTVYYLAASKKGVCYFGNNERAVVMTWLGRHFNEDVLLGSPADAHNRKYMDDLTNYFNGSLTAFDWPFDLKGTPFQQLVWEQLLTVPYGRTLTYGDIAARLNNSKAVRAVGGAIGRNPVMVAIPCHRIIGRNGKLTGFSGGLDIKRQLLDIEGIAYHD